MVVILRTQNVGVEGASWPVWSAIPTSLPAPPPGRFTCQQRLWTSCAFWGGEGSPGGPARGKEMSLSCFLGVYYKLPKSDPNAVYLLPNAVYLLQCCFIAANIGWARQCDNSLFPWKLYKINLTAQQTKNTLRKPYLMKYSPQICFASDLAHFIRSLFLNKCFTPNTAIKN